MDNLTYIAFIALTVSLALMLPLMEKKTRRAMIFMIVGIFACLFISEVNEILLKTFNKDIYYVTTTITPVTEEIIKMLPILYCAIVITDDRRTLIAHSFAVGVGFALLENVIILVGDIESVTIWWAIGRGFASSLMHSLCTAAVGYGMSFISQRKKLFISGTFSLLLFAITIHAIFNCLVQSDYPILGLILPVLNYIPIIIIQYKIKKREKSKKQDNVKKEEVS